MVEAGESGVVHDIRVRLATLDDVAVLVDFGCRLAFDTEDKTLDKPLVTAAVTRLLKNPKLGCYLLAYDNNDPE